MSYKTHRDGPPAATCAAPVAHSASTTRAALEAAWRCFHAGLQADGYTITVRDPRGGYAFNLSKLAGLPDPIPADEVIDAILADAWGALCRGWSPIARPRSGARAIFQIDDIDGPTIAAMRAAGWRPAYEQETSPGHYQAALAMGALPDRLRKDVRPRLIRLFGGDLGATGAWRIPGFRNCKPTRRFPDGSYPRVRPLSWSGASCPRTAAFVSEIATEVAADRQAIASTPSIEPTQAASLDDLADVWRRLRHHALPVYGPVWKSEHDWMMGLLLRYAGATRDEAEIALEALSPRHPGRGKGNEAAYCTAASITASRVFGPPGDAALADLAQFHWMWDRDLAEVGS